MHSSNGIIGAVGQYWTHKHFSTGDNESKVILCVFGCLWSHVNVGAFRVVDVSE